MVKKAFTLHNVMSAGRYGYESTHAYREKVFEYLNIHHIVVYTDIPNYERANWVEDLVAKGIKNFYHVILDQSPIARSVPNLNVWDIFPEGIPEDVKEILYTERGFVGQVIYYTGKREYYTSSLFLVVEDNNRFSLYSNQNAIITGYIGHFGEYVTNTGKTQMDYLLIYLVNKSDKTDIFVMDSYDQIEMYKLKRFFTYSKRILYTMIHYDIYSKYSKYLTSSWGTLLVASEPLMELMGQKGLSVQFLPPVALEHALRIKTYHRVVNWCLVGNGLPIKRVDMAIRVFQRLKGICPNLRLTIFGEIANSMVLPDNVQYAGIVTTIPYEKYEGYISCSLSELFANAMVEAAHAGLVCLVSDVDFAHRYYASKDKNIHLFSDEMELMELLIKLSEGIFDSSRFTQSYEFQHVTDNYRNVFNLD